MTQDQTSQNRRQRRTFLKSAIGVGGGIAAASFVRAFGVGSAEAAENDIATIINLATTAETLAVAFYYAVIDGAAFHISDSSAEHIKLAMDSEMHHLEILQSLGGRSMTQQFYMPKNVLSDASLFVDTGLRAETIFTGAYLAATHRLALLGQPNLAATAAQHAASEAQHLTLIRHLAGLAPNDLTLPAPIFAHASDAAPALAPFLRGGAGFGDQVRFPTPAQYQAALGDTLAARSRTFAQAHGAGAPTLARRPVEAGNA